MSLLGDLGTAIKNKLGGASVDNTVPRYDGTTCKLQGSGVTISDTNVVTASGGFVGNLTGNATNATNLNNVVEATTATANTIVKRDANGYVYVAALNSTLADTTTAATHYYCETGSDGWLRPKTLANVKAEIGESLALSGTPTAPTAAAGTNTTQIATTAFVLANSNFITYSGTAPLYACRAWVNFNGTGTVAIRGSGNVSSITDNGTGDYTINLTTAMPDANYAAVGMTEAASYDYPAVVHKRAQDPATTSSIRLLADGITGGFAPWDLSWWSVAFFR